MRSLRNSIVMAVDELFVSQMVVPNSCFVAEAVLAGRPINSVLYQLEKGDAGCNSVFIAGDRISVLGGYPRLLSIFP